MKKRIPLFLLLLTALGIRLAFLYQTNYTAEDAHITFQFARNVARGDGFAAIPGQPIYGSTTPLLTVLLAGWMFFSKDVILGARLLNFAGVLGGMTFLYFSFKDRRGILIGLFIMALSARLYVEEMQGMEMPLTFLLLAGSYYGYAHKKPYLAGVMSGLLLWTRVDTVVWAGCLFAVYLWADKSAAWKYFAVTSAVYAPWIVFSWAYFGSPIPFTIVAKQVAYGNPGALPQLLHIVRYLTLPVSLGAFAAAFLCWKKEYIVFPLFAAAEIIFLVVSGSTFFDRYFYLMTVAFYILLGIGLGWLLENRPVRSFALTLTLIAVFSFPKAAESFRDEKSMQENRHRVLAEMGTWLHDNTPPGSVVLLEPLGYVGWHADRVMLDEVGLVTPAVVELHRDGIAGSSFFKHLGPDYVIWHCDVSGPAREEIGLEYNVVKTFDSGTSRGCYEVWHTKSPRFATGAFLEGVSSVRGSVMDNYIIPLSARFVRVPV